MLFICPTVQDRYAVETWSLHKSYYKFFQYFLLKRLQGLQTSYSSVCLLCKLTLKEFLKAFVAKHAFGLPHCARQFTSASHAPHAHLPLTTSHNFLSTFAGVAQRPNAPSPQPQPHSHRPSYYIDFVAFCAQNVWAHTAGEIHDIDFWALPQQQEQPQQEEEQQERQRQRRHIYDSSTATLATLYL